MGYGPYRDAAVVIADEPAEDQWAAIETDEEIGPVVVAANGAAGASQLEMPVVVHLAATSAALVLLVTLGVVAFAGP